MKFVRPSLKKLKKAIQNRNGSEVIEMVYAVAALCAMILTALLILGYALQANSLAYASKKLTRFVEVNGAANQTVLDTMLEEVLPNASNINARVRVTMAPGYTWFDASTKKIQLRNKFKVTVTANYYVKLINPGNFSEYNNNGIPIPIRCQATGQSEIFWKTP